MEPAHTTTLAPPAGPRRKRSWKRPTAIAGISAYLITFVILLPLLWIVVLSFQPSTKILSDPLSFTSLNFDNYARAFASLPLLQMYGNTLLIAIPAVTLGAVVSFMVSFGLVTMVFKRQWAQAALRLYILAGLAVPVYILLFPVYRLVLVLGIYGTFWSLIIPYVAVSIPFNTLLITGFLREMPKEIIEAAIIDGVGLFTLIWHVVLPIMRPVVATVLIFNVIYVFNEFPFASILITDHSMNTVALAISQFQGQWSVDYGGMMAAATIILIPQVILYIVFQKQVVAGMTLGAVKG